MAGPVGPGSSFVTVVAASDGREAEGDVQIGSRTKQSGWASHLLELQFVIGLAYELRESRAVHPADRARVGPPMWRSPLLHLADERLRDPFQVFS